MNLSAKSVGKLKRGLVIGLIVAVCLHIATVVADRYLQPHILTRALSYFDLDREFAVVSIYTSLMLLMASGLSVLIAIAEEVKYKMMWFLIAVGFFYLALDESFVIHERIAEPLRKLLSIGDESPLYHAWVIPAILIVIVGLVLSVVAIYKRMISRRQTTVISLVMLLIIIDVLLESFGTKFYFTPMIYRLGPVFAEEIWELGMISYIVYRIARFSVTKSKSKPARTGRIRESLSSVSH